MKLEICANSFKSAVNAQKGGASQIELCSQLAVGGLTPSYGLIKKVLDSLKIPVNVLIRPRGGDFCYTAEEFEIMKNDIRMCKDMGLAGIVTGILTGTYRLDFERNKELVELARPMHFTFHRAFDLIEKPFEAFADLVKLKVDSVLTSGRSKTALEGIELLKELLATAGNNVTIMPGGGINGGNAQKFRTAGFQIIHASASRKIENYKKNLNEIENQFFGYYQDTFSDLHEIKKIISAIV